MTESLTVFTVTTEWEEDSSVKGKATYESVVGTLTPRGEELWVPNDPKLYKNAQVYSDGYSAADIKEATLSLSEDKLIKFTEFFKNLLIKRRWATEPISKDLYDCHWFAQWLEHKVDRHTSTQRTLHNAGKVISQGSIVERPLEQGEVGVLGVASAIFDTHYPEHTIIGLDGSNVLQVMGVHGPVAISPQAETSQHYLEISDAVNYMNTRPFGLHVPAEITARESEEDLQPAA